MFADLELAARIEKAEARLTREAGRAFGRTHADGSAFAIDIGGGVAALLRQGSPMNKVIGIFGGFPPEALVRGRMPWAPLQSALLARHSGAREGRLTRVMKPAPVRHSRPTSPSPACAARCSWMPSRSDRLCSPTRRPAAYGSADSDPVRPLSSNPQWKFAS